MQKEIDLQASRILAGLTQLADVLKSDPVMLALELETSLTTARQHELLTRLQRSLSQYVNRQSGLFYVGLIGHFSTGKSSTINSLLQIGDTNDARETGQNPTDKYITLISDPKNAGSLLGIAREGSVTIRYHGLEHTMLDHIVLVDTPGQGDPGLMTEMARDFLPLCDLILFTFSAASPFDAADVSLLTEIHDRLSFVPLHFVVTRANEFTKQGRTLASVDDLESRDLRRFFDALIPRVNNLTQPTVYTESDFTLIDNLSGLNIDLLRNFILERCDPQRVDATISMRDHKILYFRETAKEISAHFNNFIATKLHTLDEMIGQTRRNIDRYNQAVGISNIQITRRLHEQLTKITTAQSDAKADLTAPVFMPSNWEASDLVQKKRRETMLAIQEESKRLAGVINARIRDRATQQFSDYMRNYRAQLDIIALLDGSNHTVDPVRVELRKEPGSLYLTDPKRIASWWEELRRSETDGLAQVTEQVRRKISTLDAFVRSRPAFAIADHVVEEMQVLLLEDLNRFFSQVELYIDGVVNLATKQSVAALGIGGKLDALLVALQETDKAAYNQEAIDAVFPDYSNIQIRAATAFVDLGDRVRKLQDDVRTIRSPAPPSPLSEGIALEMPTFKEDAEAKMQLEVDRLSNEATKIISDEIHQVKQRFDAAISVAKAERRRRYLIATLGFGLAATAIVLGFRFFGMAAGGSIVETILWGLAGNFIGDVVGYLIGRFSDNYPASKRDIEARFETEAKARIDNLSNDVLHGDRFKELELTGQGQFADALIKAVDMSGDAWGTIGSTHFSTVSQLHERAKALTQEALALLDGLDVVAGYFASPEQTLESLRRVGDKIKEQAIEPSFHLLDATRTDLEEVNKRMAAIEFA